MKTQVLDSNLNLFIELDKNKLDIKFISLFFDKNENLNLETANNTSELQHNSIMEEFDEFYNREQDMIYDE